MSKKSKRKLEDHFIVWARVRMRVLGVGTSEHQRIKNAQQRASGVMTRSGFLKHQIQSTEPVETLFADNPVELFAEPPPQTVKAIIAFARATWHNDGAEGEAVHKLCDTIEQLWDSYRADNLVKSLSDKGIALQKAEERIEQLERALRDATDGLAEGTALRRRCRDVLASS